MTPNRQQQQQQQQFVQLNSIANSPQRIVTACTDERLHPEKRIDQNGPQTRNHCVWLPKSLKRRNHFARFLANYNAVLSWIFIALCRFLKRKVTPRIAWRQTTTTDIEERPRETLCQLTSCQLLHNCTKKISFEKACHRWMTLKVTQGHWNCRYLIDHYITSY